MPPVSIRLLGGFEYREGARRVPIAAGAQRLVQLLALSPDPVTRAKAAATLWPDQTGVRATANLRTALWRLDRTRPTTVHRDGDHLTLGHHPTVDLWEGTTLARTIIDGDIHLPTTPRVGPRLRTLLLRDLLPDHTDEDWLTDERERFRQLRLHALDIACRTLATAGHYGLATELAQAVLRTEPYRESAHMTLIDIHLAEGNRWEAMRQFDTCRRVLADDLGLEPSDRLRTRLTHSAQLS